MKFVMPEKDDSSLCCVFYYHYLFMYLVNIQGSNYVTKGKELTIKNCGCNSFLMILRQRVGDK